MGKNGDGSRMPRKKFSPGFGLAFFAKICQFSAIFPVVVHFEGGTQILYVKERSAKDSEMVLLSSAI